MVNGRTDAEDMAARHEGRNGEPPQWPRWIPVAERLPDQGVRVLVYDGDFRECEIGDYYADTGWAGGEVLRPTHWMPLPPPPEEEKP